MAILFDSKTMKKLVGKNVRIQIKDNSYRVGKLEAHNHKYTRINGRIYANADIQNVALYNQTV